MMKALFELRKSLFFRQSLRPGLMNNFFLSKIDSLDEQSWLSAQSISWERMYKYVVNIHFFLHVFSLLHHKKPSKEALFFGYMMAGFIPLYDDLMDQEGYKHEDVMSLLQKKDGTHSIQADVAGFFYRKMFSNSIHHDSIHRFLSLGGIAQNDSLLQKQPIDHSTLESITQRKGGYFLLLVRCCLQQNISKEEEDMIFRLGGLIQFLDDVFDVYKDVQEGVQTIPNQCRSIPKLKQDYLEWIQQWRDSLQSLSTKNRTTFRASITLLLSTGMVCLQQYGKLPKQSDANFVASQYDRKQLICDMGKPINGLLALYYWWYLYRK